MTIENKKIQTITEVITKAVIVNNTTDVCIFIDYSGHINKLELSIRESKEDFNNILASCNIRLSPFTPNNLDKNYLEKFNNELIDELNAVSETLSEIIRDNKNKKEKLIGIVNNVKSA